MFEDFRKRRLLRMFRTDSEITGMAWLQLFLSLRNEATEYIDKFITALGDLPQLAREVKSTRETLEIFDALEFETVEKIEEAAETMARETEEVERREGALIGRKKQALPAAKEAVEKLPLILSKIGNLPELKSERAQQAKNLWDAGLRNIIEACDSYIYWCETRELEHVIPELIQASSKLQGYIYSCGTRKAWLNSISPEVRPSFEKITSSETLIELIQPLLKEKEDVVSHISTKITIEEVDIK